MHTLCAIGDQTGSRVQALRLIRRILSDDEFFPHSSCKREFEAYVELYPPPINANYGSLFRWSVDAHNSVNCRLGKPMWTYTEAAVEHRLSLG